MTAAPSLKELLLGEEGHRFSFLQVVRLLELTYLGSKSAEGKTKTSVGQGIDPEQEVLRLCANPSMSFPPAEVLAVGFDPHRAGSRPSETLPIPVIAAELGLFGPHGALPLHYTVLIRERIRRGDFALRDFLDLFNHRFLSFFYRAWAVNHPEIEFEQAAKTGSGPDSFSRLLYSLIGIPSHKQRGPETTASAAPVLATSALLPYAGLLAQGPRSAAALQALLCDYFEPLLQEPIDEQTEGGRAANRSQSSVRWRRLVRIEEFLPQYLPVTPMDQTSLGEHNQGLGESLVLGDEVCVENAKFRILLGPLSYRQFTEFLPPGSDASPRQAFVELVQLTRFFVGPELDFDVQLLLRPHEMCGFALGSNDLGGARLGSSTWLVNEPPKELRQEAIYSSRLVENWLSE